MVTNAKVLAVTLFYAKIVDKFFTFCYCAILPSNLNARIGLCISVFHLFYMDDLKRFARNVNKLEKTLATAKEFSNDIGMTFGLEKCAMVSFLRGFIRKKADTKFDINTSDWNLLDLQRMDRKLESC